MACLFDVGPAWNGHTYTLGRHASKRIDTATYVHAEPKFEWLKSRLRVLFIEFNREDPRATTATLKKMRQRLS